MTPPSTTTERFELALLADRDINEPVTLAELLGRAEREEAMPNVRLDDATLLFESGGRDWMPLHWVLGEVGTLAGQFEAAAERLGRDEIAIVRSAVDDRPVVAYFLFAPDGPEVVISIFHPPIELRYAYPTASALGAELYDYVAAHRAELLTREPGDDQANDIHGARISGDVLVPSLEREAVRARRVVALLDG